MMKRGLFLAAFAPFLYKVPYLIGAWRTSPLDRYDGVFFLLPFLLIVLRFRWLKTWVEKSDWRGWFLFGAAALFFSAATVKHISTFQLAGGLALISATVFLLWGEKLFLATIPLLAISVLGCPSTTYWTEYFLRDQLTAFSVSGFSLKLTAAACLGCYFAFQKKTMRLSSLSFSTGLVLIGCVLLWQGARPEYGAPLIANGSLRRVSDYLGFPLSITPVDKRFFGDNLLVRSAYINSSGARIDLLDVRITGNVHSIHHAEICLKSGGNEILSRREIKLDTTYGPLACQELIVRPRNNNQNQLILVWYSNSNWSSGNFLSFRRHWTPGSLWYTFQLSTPVTTTPADALLRLKDFLDFDLKELPVENRQ